MSDTIPAPASLHPAIPLQVSLAAGSPIGITELEVVYDGTAPPFELFSALARGGWNQPVVSPPPRSAIDWGTPDPVNGTRYTISPYRAVSRVAPKSDRASGDLIDAAMTMARAHGASVPDHPVDETTRTDTLADTLTDIVVSAVIATARLEGTLEMFGPSVVVLERTPTVITATNTYRGRTCESQSPAIRLSVCVPAAGLDEVTSILQQVSASAPEVHSNAG